MEILEKKLYRIANENPQVVNFFDNHGIQLESIDVTLRQYLDTLTLEQFEDIGIDKNRLIENLAGFLLNESQHKTQNGFEVSSITLIGGFDKQKKAENISISFPAGSITCIVGPTGSGKSRLLGDIEWMAQGDTPTGRKILVNNQVPDTSLRFSLEHKLVAQLSQNMNFVMDTSVDEFIAMHAESRMIKDIDRVVLDIIAQANLLAGEQFAPNTPITALSGGQSRALMIADTAFLSTSPVVLIDEIENAGIDRKRALQLLVKKEKIVLMATHDPILALMGDQRIVIKNGGIHSLIQTTAKEKQNLTALEQMDAQMQALRNRLRMGDIIETI